MNYLKKIINLNLKLAYRLLICVAIGTVLISLVYMVPLQRIEKNVKESVSIFEKEGVYPNFGYKKILNSTRDNFSDALMLLEASNEKSGTIKYAMLNYRSQIDELGTVDTLIAHYKKNVEYNKNVMYGRYWNGHLVFLKPLLLIFSYAVIRCLNAIILIIITIILLLMLRKKDLSQYMIAYIISFLMMMPLAIALNLQNTVCLCIFSVGMISLLKTKKDINQCDIFIFLYLGIATAFFDELSYPLATFGVPAVLLFAISNKKKIKDSIIRIVKIGYVWCFGYLGMWVCKWAVGTLISKKNIFNSALDTVKYRMGDSDPKVATKSLEEYTIFGTITKNVIAFFRTPITLVLMVFIIVMVVLIIKQIRQKKVKLIDILEIVFPFLIVAVLPFAWYTVTRNHSSIHFKVFTNKILVISAFSVMCCLIKIYNYIKNSSEKDAKNDQQEVL